MSVRSCEVTFTSEMAVISKVMNGLGPCHLVRYTDYTVIGCARYRWYIASGRAAINWPTDCSQSIRQIAFTLMLVNNML
jgi:hypothetical protein